MRWCRCRAAGGKRWRPVLPGWRRRRARRLPVRTRTGGRTSLDGVTGRRGLLKHGALLAAGAVAGGTALVVAAASPAEATTGNMQYGVYNDAGTDETSLDSSSDATLTLSNSGTGIPLLAVSGFESSTEAPAIQVEQNGLGDGIDSLVTSGPGSAVLGTVSSGGLGSALAGEITNLSNTSPVIYASTASGPGLVAYAGGSYRGVYGQSNSGPGFTGPRVLGRGCKPRAPPSGVFTAPRPPRPGCSGRAPPATRSKVKTRTPPTHEPRSTAKPTAPAQHSSAKSSCGTIIRRRVGVRLLHHLPFVQQLCARSRRLQSRPALLTGQNPDLPGRPVLPNYAGRRELGSLRARQRGEMVQRHLLTRRNRLDAG
jgi:hypothetical protein